MANEPKAAPAGPRASKGKIVTFGVALLLGAGAYVATQTDLLKGKPKPTSQHPFQYFKLTNNTGRPIKTAKLEASRKCSASPYQYVTTTWNPPLAGNGDYLATFSSGWSHVYALRLTVEFSDALNPASASDSWSLAAGGPDCYQDSAAACTMTQSGSTVSFVANLPYTGGDLPCP